MFSSRCIRFAEDLGLRAARSCQQSTTDPNTGSANGSNYGRGQSAPRRKESLAMQIRLPGARIVGVVAAIGVLAGGAAYAGTTTSSKVTKVGFASPAKASDYGWNQQ